MAAIVLAVVHIAILAAYTFPARIVPVRAKYWSQAYARVLFHQDWRLFAPDPPECACDLVMDNGLRLKHQHRHFIWRRMAANACRFAEALSRDQPGASPVMAPEVLARSIENMSGLPIDRMTMVRTCSPGTGMEIAPLTRAPR
jgi:hypothetical protein